MSESKTVLSVEKNDIGGHIVLYGGRELGYLTEAPQFEYGSPWGGRFQFSITLRGMEFPPPPPKPKFDRPKKRSVAKAFGLRGPQPQGYTPEQHEQMKEALRNPFL